MVQAVADPDRMMSHTQAWKSRQSNGQEFELQRPLYNINTYTDTQVRLYVHPLVTFDIA